MTHIITIDSTTYYQTDDVPSHAFYGGVSGSKYELDALEAYQISLVERRIHPETREAVYDIHFTSEEAMFNFQMKYL